MEWIVIRHDHVERKIKCLDSVYKIPLDSAMFKALIKNEQEWLTFQSVHLGQGIPTVKPAEYPCLVFVHGGRASMVYPSDIKTLLGIE